MLTPPSNREELAVMMHSIGLQLDQMISLYNHSALAGAMFGRVAVLHSLLRQRGVLDVGDLSQMYENALSIALSDDDTGLPPPGPVPQSN
jgi:hypothetical protein